MAVVRIISQMDIRLNVMSVVSYFMINVDIQEWIDLFCV